MENKVGAHPPISHIGELKSFAEVAEKLGADAAKLYMMCNELDRESKKENLLHFFSVSASKYGSSQGNGFILYQYSFVDNPEVPKALSDKVRSLYLNKDIEKIVKVAAVDSPRLEYFPLKKNNCLTLPILLDLLEEKKLAKPSTYATILGSIEKPLEGEKNLVFFAEKGELEVSPEGKEVLRYFEGKGSFRLDEKYTQSMESLLDAIEHNNMGISEAIGQATPFLNGSSDLMSSLSQELNMANASSGSQQEREKSWETLAKEIPSAINPLYDNENKTYFLNIQKELDMEIELLGMEKKDKPLARAIILQRSMNEKSNKNYLRRITYDLGIRMILGLSFFEEVWSEDVYTFERKNIDQNES